MKHNPTTSIKCTFSNGVHKLLEPNINLKGRQRWRVPKKELTNEEKIEIFDQIVALHTETSNELTHFLYDRRVKKRIQKARIERGVEPKKKVSKDEYLKAKTEA